MSQSNSRLQIIQEFARAAAKAIFVNYFSLTLVAVGLGLIVLLAAVPGSDFSPAWWRAPAKSIGEAILVAGAVTTFMRFFASLDLVGERIKSWLSDEKYLEALSRRVSLAVYEPDRAKDLGDLQLLWRRISLVVTRNAFPQIDESVYSRILEKLISASADYYYDTYNRSTEIRIIDAASGLIEMEHTVRCTVVANQSKASVLFRGRLSLKLVDGWEPQVKYFHVDGKPQTLTPRKVQCDRTEETEYSLEAPVPASQSIQVSYSYVVRQSLSNDPFLTWTTSRYVRNAEHELRYSHALVESIYQDASIDPVLVPEPASRPGCLVYVSRPGDLILPGSAFMFVLRIRSQPHA
jgi:hypothetical protein